MTRNLATVPIPEIPRCSDGYVREPVVERARIKACSRSTSLSNIRVNERLHNVDARTPCPKTPAASRGDLCSYCVGFGTTSEMPHVSLSYIDLYRSTVQLELRLASLRYRL